MVFGDFLFNSLFPKLSELQIISIWNEIIINKLQKQDHENRRRDVISLNQLRGMSAKSRLRAAMAE